MQRLIPQRLILAAVIVVPGCLATGCGSAAKSVISSLPSRSASILPSRPPSSQPGPAGTISPSPTVTAAPAPQPTPAAPTETAPPKRIVSREGTVVVSRSVQAPTKYALESRESRRTINYLHSESEEINLKKFAGKKVIVAGAELLDQRWTNTPILEVDQVQVVP